MNKLPRLKVYRKEGSILNGRFIVTADGRPFYYLGDTAWELFHRLKKEEIVYYFKNRVKKGFTVIQSVILSGFNGLSEPNPYGVLPLINNDPTNPNEEYFEHVDFAVDKAEELGLYMAILPTWGDKVNKKWGIGPEIFTPENARIYGEFLGRRYRNKPIIWVLGGDRPIENNVHLSIWRSMAEGIREGDKGEHLITYHPMGRTSSSMWLHDEDWLDFNMLQSGHHERHFPNYKMIARDYRLYPVKPCIDGELRYENIPVGFKTSNGRFDDHDVREAAYWSLFSGAFGFTYGCNEVFQFYDPLKYRPLFFARYHWKNALDLPAAEQVRYSKELLMSRSPLLRKPDYSILVSDPGVGAEHIVSSRAIDGSYAYIYIPTGISVKIDMNKLSGEVEVYWFDPVSGSKYRIGRYKNNGKKKFTPPTSGPKEDWILVLDTLDED
ncbi:MAG: glycoside hydrolase family 140 protein [Thermoproteales archaeon]|nr:glycoside hydrolase family 140 protein [Thermoproteales archaeon]